MHGSCLSGTAEVTGRREEKGSRNTRPVGSRRPPEAEGTYGSCRGARISIRQSSPSRNLPYSKVWFLEFSRDACLLASGSADCTVRVRRAVGSAVLEAKSSGHEPSRLNLDVRCARPLKSEGYFFLKLVRFRARFQLQVKKAGCLRTWRTQ